MKKLLLIVPLILLLAVFGCNRDKNNNCACDGSFGTNFYGDSADINCAAWKLKACPKTYVCTCTLGAPAAEYVNVDSATASGKCAYAQSKLQNLYPGTVCGL